MHYSYGCNSNNTGTVSLTVTGGTQPYNYNWNSNSYTTENLTGISAGTYNVTVSDAKGCITATAITVGQPDLLTADAIPYSLNCNGDNSGVVTLVVSGGTPSYSFDWNSGAYNTQDLFGIPAGIYTVLVTDANGCMTMTSTIVTEPAVLSAVTGETDLLCNGDGSGTANVTINGGIAPYYYNWDTGDTTPVITGLYAGTYEVSITDNNGCMLIVDVTVNEPDFLIANSTGTQVFNLLCNGDGSGAILLATTGGTPGYSYYWNGPNSYSAYDQDIFSLYSGTYYVTATDVNGCTDSSSVIVTQPNILIAIASGTNLTCNSNNTGTVSVSVTGGTTPYNYSWSNGATVYNNTGLSAGTYTITVTDANGCSTSSSVTITQPPLTVITISGNLAVCSGDTTTLTASGATSYSWSPATGLNTTTGATVKSHPPTLNPITYTITGTNNCGSFSTSVTVTPGSPSFTYTATNALCNGGTGSITINATGGVSPYTYKVTNTTSNVVITQIGNNVFTGLASNAQYRMQVIDATGCASSISTIIITQPNILAVVVAKTNVTCNGSSNGILTCTANGGTGIKTYSDNGGSSFQPSNVFLGLAAGTYNVVVKDANGCISSVSIQTITQPALLTFTTTVSISCS